MHLSVCHAMVALLAEGVDRNSRELLNVVCQRSVALLAEGVDRNGVYAWDPDKDDTVALLAEGVDRNIGCIQMVVGAVRRPPRGGRG